MQKAHFEEYIKYLIEFKSPYEHQLCSFCGQTLSRFFTFSMLSGSNNSLKIKNGLRHIKKNILLQLIFIIFFHI
jgi:hypothetical protein